MSSLLLLTLLAMSLGSGLTRLLPDLRGFPPDAYGNLNLVQRFPQADASPSAAYLNQVPWPIAYALAKENPEDFGVEVDTPAEQDDAYLSSEQNGNFNEKPKRNNKNYSACHFKICGLGRKRSRASNTEVRSVRPRDSQNT